MHAYSFSRLRRQLPLGGSLSYNTFCVDFLFTFYLSAEPLLNHATIAWFSSYKKQPSLHFGTRASLNPSFLAVFTYLSNQRSHLSMSALICAANLAFSLFGRLSQRFARASSASACDTRSRWMLFFLERALAASAAVTRFFSI